MEVDTKCYRNAKGLHRVVFKLMPAYWHALIFVEDMALRKDKKFEGGHNQYTEIP